MKPREARRGSVALATIGIVAILSALVFGYTVFYDGNEERFAIVAFAISAIVAATCVAYGIRRDFYSFCLYTGLFSSTAITGGVVVAFASATPMGTGWLIFFLVCGAWTLVVFAVVGAPYYRRDAAPEVLREWGGEGEIWERAGVQFAMLDPNPELAPGGMVYAPLMIQSCVDAPRVIRVELVNLARRKKKREAVRLPRAWEIELAPREVGRVRLPFGATADAPATQVATRLHIECRGKSAKRVRHTRAQQLPQRSQLLPLLGLVAGVNHEGGGIPVTVRISADGAADATPLHPNWRRLWPDPPAIPGVFNDLGDT